MNTDIIITRLMDRISYIEETFKCKFEQAFPELTKEVWLAIDSKNYYNIQSVVNKLEEFIQ